jgi:hypothetical protein
MAKIPPSYCQEKYESPYWEKRRNLDRLRIPSYNILEPS